MFRTMLCGAVVLMVVQAAAAQNPVFESLTTEGLNLGGEKYVLPAPAMGDDLTAEEQNKVIAKVADRYDRDLFLRKSTAAPIALELNKIKKDGKRVGQTVDLYFAAHGTLADLEKDQFFKDLLPEAKGGDLPAVGRKLTPAELAAHNLEPVEKAGTKEGYSYFSITLIDTLEKAQLSGVAHTFQTESPGGILAAMRMDPAFLNDDQLPCIWQTIEKDSKNKSVLGEVKHPYADSGGYFKLTELKEPQGVLFVECHVAFDEPEGWFGGADLLGSKLPIAIKDNVKTFRLKLSKAARAK